MPDFEVALHEPGGAPRRLRVSAGSADQVAATLGVAPGRLLSVQPSALRAADSRPRSGSLSLRLFSQETSILLDAGIPLLESLQTLQQKEARPDAALILQQLCAALQEGRSLSDALAAQPAVFDALFIAIVRANERSGSLAAALREHARYLSWAGQIRDRLVSALIYPTLLLVAGSAVVLFLLLFVLPRFAGVFDAQAVELPWASKFLFAMAGQWADRPLLAVLLACLPGALAVLAWRQAATRAALAALGWRLPGLGPQLRTLALAATYRAMALLMNAGVPVPAAMTLVLDMAAAPLRSAWQRAAVRVSEGQRLSDALELEDLATPVARRMLRVGEQGGELAQMLARSAAFHDEELQRLSDWIGNALNPLLMLAVGVLVGGIVVLMYLPLFQMIELVQ